MHQRPSIWDYNLKTSLARKQLHKQLNNAMWLSWTRMLNVLVGRARKTTAKFICRSVWHYFSFLVLFIPVHVYVYKEKRPCNHDDGGGCNFASFPAAFVFSQSGCKIRPWPVFAACAVLHMRKYLLHSRGRNAAFCYNSSIYIRVEEAGVRVEGQIQVFVTPAWSPSREPSL